MTAKTAKYSPTMLQALRNVFAPGASDRESEGVKGHYWTNANTAVALMSRGALVNLSSSRQGITREGADAIGADYDALISRAHEQALIDNANFRRCPLADEGCDFVAFGRPATPYGNHQEITSDDQITYHLNRGHMPMTEASFITSIAHLTDEYRTQVAEFVEAYRAAKAHDARTGVGTGTSEARCRRAKREGTLVYVEGSEGRIDDVAVLGGVKFHVTGVSLDGWYYPNQITVYDGPADAQEDAISTYADNLTATHDREAQAAVEASGSATASQNRDYAERGANTDYAVDIPVKGPQRCNRTELHGPHVWSWLGPDPSWYCCGTDEIMPQADPEQPTTTWAQYHENHPEVAASWGEQNGRRVNCGCPKCDPDGLQPRPDILVDDPHHALPELYGPVADDHGSPLLRTAAQIIGRTLGETDYDTDRPVALKASLDPDEWASGVFSYVSYTTAGSE